ncbi:MAG: hypothetical protein DI533_00375 [Cereibacter sphaeroides]|uniref:Terminase n=1 Tax=Cereibacter sphaeroides TaxID=1063 RepID=A0A2W5S8A2_CERSP|nr:MAG: hypothetical protein DI533_00375 [Cereibacter sphaeroides]
MTIMPYVPDGPVLTKFLWDRSKCPIIQGPIESGTSTCCCHKIWVHANEQLPDNDGVRRTRWITTRDTYKDLRETTIKTWLTWFPEREWGPMAWSEPMTHVLRRPHFSGDGTITECENIFLAIPDPDIARRMLASFEITGWWRNEGQFVEKRVVDELHSRTARYPSRRNGPGATWFGGFIDMNAPLEGHWIPYMRGDVPIPADFTDDQRAVLQRPDNWTFYMQPPGLLEKIVDGKVTYLPNPEAENQKHITEPYIDKIVGKDKDWIDERIMSRTGIHAGGKPVYPMFFAADHISNRDIDPVTGAQIIVGLDFGREPAAVFTQCINERWTVLSELIGSNESAEIFAPRVKKHLAQKYPGFKVVFYGDPRGADRGQNVEVTAYDIYAHHGMTISPATSDNNVEMRRSAMSSVLNRRNGMRVSASCTTLKVGMAGGYHYPKIRGTGGFSEKPKKNVYSHACEALENAILGGGEGDILVRPPEAMRKKASRPFRHRVQLVRR